MRLYLTGRLCIEDGDMLLDERRFPGKQGRLVFAMLAVERRPVPRDELAEALWPGELPKSWDTALSAVVSNLRALLAKVGLSRGDCIATSFGCYELHLPRDTWIDVDAAVAALDEAEGALRAGDYRRAWGWVGVTTAIARRPFLPGETGAWVERRREHLRGLLVRGLDCFAEILTLHGECALAAEALRESLALEPYRETGYRHLMRLHHASGNRADALRVYDRCRRLLSEELGTDPSAQTEAVYLAILGAPQSPHPTLSTAVERDHGPCSPLRRGEGLGVRSRLPSPSQWRGAGGEATIPRMEAPLADV